MPLSYFIAHEMVKLLSDLCDSMPLSCVIVCGTVQINKKKENREKTFISEIIWAEKTIMIQAGIFSGLK